MDVSNRIKGIGFSPIRKLTPFADEAERRGIKVLHLNIGQPDIKTPAEVYDYFHNLKPGVIAYGPSQGGLDIRTSFSKYYNGMGLDISPDEVMVTTGGSEALTFVLSVVCDPGAEVVITEPLYTNVVTMARMFGIKLVPVTSRIEENFKLPPISEFEKAITPRTRLVMLTSPNNPTGHVYTSDEMLEILKLCKKHDLFLAVDEVYREFCYDGKKFTDVLSFTEFKDRVICTDSVSKRYSLCGARIGTIVSKNHDILKECLKLGQARLCPPVMGQQAALRAMGISASEIEKIREEYEKRRNFITARLKKIPNIVCSRPAGAFYLIAELPVDDAEDFSAFMLKDFSYNGKTVMMAPAAGFYIHSELGKRQVRLAYVLEVDRLGEAMDCLERGLQAYGKRH